MKTVTLILIANCFSILLSSISLAAQNKLEIHLPCDKLTADCVSVPFIDKADRTILIKKAPALTATESEIATVRPIKANGQNLISIGFTPTKQHEFQKLFEDNLGKVLVVTHEQQAVTAPHISGPTMTDEFVISIGVTDNNKTYVEKIPWLKKLEGRERKKSTYDN